MVVVTPSLRQSAFVCSSIDRSRSRGSASPGTGIAGPGSLPGSCAGWPAMFALWLARVRACCVSLDRSSSLSHPRPSPGRLTDWPTSHASNQLARHTCGSSQNLVVLLFATTTTMNRYVNVETAEVQEQATLLAEVLQRCIHFLTWPRLRLQLVLLDTVGVAIRALHALDERRAVAIAAAEADLAEERRHSAAARRRDVEFQDDPRLLPAIHGIWPGLAPLLRASLDEEPLTRVVYSAALRVLSALVECASSFIRQRFQTDVWPVLRHNLRMASRWARATHATTATDIDTDAARSRACLLYTSPSPRDRG